MQVPTPLPAYRGDSLSTPAVGLGEWGGSAAGRIVLMESVQVPTPLPVCWEDSQSIPIVDLGEWGGSAILEIWHMRLQTARTVRCERPSCGVAGMAHLQEQAPFSRCIWMNANHNRRIPLASQVDTQSASLSWK